MFSVWRATCTGELTSSDSVELASWAQSTSSTALCVKTSQDGPYILASDGRCARVSECRPEYGGWLYDIYLNRCLQSCPPETPFWTSGISQCTPQCSLGYIPQKVSNPGGQELLCCPSTCATCSLVEGQVQCSSCATGSSLVQWSGALLPNTYFKGGQHCCPPGQLATTSPRFRVISCTDGCSSSAALSYFHGGEDNQQLCKSCSSTCWSCSGSDAAQCTSCKMGNGPVWVGIIPVTIILNTLFLSLNTNLQAHTQLGLTCRLPSQAQLKAHAFDAPGAVPHAS